MPRSRKAEELLRASAGGLRLSLNDHTIALERREVLSHGVVCDAEPFRQFFDGEALLVLEEQGTEALRERLEGMGKAVGRQVATRLAGVKDRAERIRALSGIMRELGYQSGSVDPANEKLPAIEATNCVFHSLAQRYPEVCYFDLALMSEIVGRDAIHDECMVRGGNVCRFKFKERP